MTSIESLQRQARIAGLRNLIRHHRIQYYNGMPQISDEEFDAYVDELRELDPADEVLFEVGAPVPDDSKWITGEHRIPMASLNKVNTQVEFDEWTNRVGSTPDLSMFIVQEKLDGLSVSLDYEDGRLVRVLTRGAGITGEDVTRNVVRAQGVKQDLGQPFTGSIRGEAMLLDDDFHTYNRKAARKGWTVFKNRRNGAAGLVRRLSGEGVEYLTVIFYDVAGTAFVSERSKVEWLISCGLKVPFFQTGSASVIQEIYDDYEREVRTLLPYDIDGLVVKVNLRTAAEEVERRLDSGSKSDRNPKSQVAWKFADETRVTQLLDVVWQTGKSGRITPVAILEPVALGGVTIKRAGLHNLSNIRDLGLTIGAKVLIKRANEVIPQVVKSLDATTRWITAPGTCAVCGGSTTLDGKYVICPSVTCPARLIGNVRKWIEYLEIDYFGESLIEKLVDAGKLRTVADLYRLTEADLVALDGVGTRGAQRALRNLHSRRTIPLYLLFGSLNVSGFGRSLTKYMIEDGLDTPDRILEADVGRLSTVPKFGPERATMVATALRQLEPVVRDLLGFLEIEQVDPAGAEGSLSGKSFCITGRLSRPKKKWQEEIEAVGGIYEKSVKRGLDFLVCADPSSGSSKLKKAAKLGVAVISEEQLGELL